METRPPTPLDNKMNSQFVRRGLVIGVITTVLALILAILSAGAGHGNYAFACLMFPYTMLLTPVADNRITLPLILIALFQFPLYGALIGWFWSSKEIAIVMAAVITILHVTSAWICFWGVLPNFS